MNNIKAILLVSTVFAFSGLAHAAVMYGPNQHPFQMKQKANPYKANNPYDKNNNNNPYSTFQSPYNPQSVRNNPQQYAPKVVNPQNKQSGIITNDFRNKNSILSPYNQHGNTYNNNSMKNQYNEDKNLYPYNQFNQPYNPNSVYNSPNYAAPIYDNQGNYVGSMKSGTYDNQKSALNPYSKYGNNYNNKSFLDPYGEPNQ